MQNAVDIHRFRFINSIARRIGNATFTKVCNNLVGTLKILENYIHRN